MIPKTGDRMKALIAAALIVIAGTALADRAEDIAAQITIISGTDSVKAVVAADEALASADTVLRGTALEAALKSQNTRVRQVAFSHLVEVQKIFTVDLTVPKTGDSPFLNATAATSTLRIVTDHYDKATGQFDGTVPVINGWMKGTVARDGITFTFRWNADCTLRLSGIEGDNLTGTLKCGTQTVKAQSALR